MLFHPTYFPSIYQFSKMLQRKELIFEVEDNFQKQTYRNRCFILGPNGKQLLNVPVQKETGKQKTKNLQINYSEDWQKNHLRALDTAYRSSPFYEFYIDDILPIFEKKELLLIDLNINIFEVLCRLIQIEVPYIKTKVFHKEAINDFRTLVNAKKPIICKFPEYTQVFSNKHGFTENLSILDLLFMEGPNTLMYLEKLNFNS